MFLCQFYWQSDIQKLCFFTWKIAHFSFLRWSISFFEIIILAFVYSLANATIQVECSILREYNRQVSLWNEIRQLSVRKLRRYIPKFSWLMCTKPSKCKVSRLFQECTLSREILDENQRRTLVVLVLRGQKEMPWFSKYNNKGRRGR